MKTLFWVLQGLLNNLINIIVWACCFICCLILEVLYRLCSWLSFLRGSTLMCKRWLLRFQDVWCNIRALVENLVIAYCLQELLMSCLDWAILTSFLLVWMFHLRGYILVSELLLHLVPVLHIVIHIIHIIVSILWRRYWAIGTVTVLIFWVRFQKFKSITHLSTSIKSKTCDSCALTHIPIYD